MDNLQALIDATPDGETLVLSTGEYQGPVTIHRCINIEGQKCTIWSKQGPVVRVSASGVALRALRIEVTQFSDEVEEKPEHTAILVDDGIDVILEDVIARGYIIGIEGENGAWLIPPSVELGRFTPRATNTFLLRLFVPVICQISTDITGVTISPSSLKPGLNELEIIVKDVYPDVLLLGRCYLRSAHVKRPIGITGRALEDKKTPPVDRRFLWEPSHIPSLAEPSNAQDASPVVTQPLQPAPVKQAAENNGRGAITQDSSVIDQSAPPFMPAEDAAATDMPGPTAGIPIPPDPVEVCSPIVSENNSVELDSDDMVSLPTVTGRNEADAAAVSIPVQPPAAPVPQPLQQPAQTKPASPRKPSVYRPGTDLSPLFTAKPTLPSSMEGGAEPAHPTAPVEPLPNKQADVDTQQQLVDEGSTSTRVDKKNPVKVTVPPLFTQRPVPPVPQDQVAAVTDTTESNRDDNVSPARSVIVPRRRSVSSSLPTVFGGTSASEALDSPDATTESKAGDMHAGLSPSLPTPSPSTRPVGQSPIFGAAFKSGSTDEEASAPQEPPDNQKASPKTVASPNLKLGDAFKLPSD